MSGVRYYRTGGKRYYVIALGGYRISTGDGSRKFATSYSVLDRDWNHREMAQFVPGGFGHRSSSERCRKAAEEVAANLNAREKADAA